MVDYFHRHSSYLQRLDDSLERYIGELLPIRHSCERLHGFRRYDSMDGIGRVVSGTKTESEAGARAEAGI